MVKNISIAMAQLDPTVGSIDENTNKLIAEYRKVSASSDLLVTSELYLSGYPPEDLVMRREFQEIIHSKTRDIVSETLDSRAWMILGTPWVENDELYNAALVIGEGKIQQVCRKSRLPNYGVFDEIRVFSQGPTPTPVLIHNVPFGILICEEIWSAEPVRGLKDSGAEILIVINGSPYDVTKIAEREKQTFSRIDETKLPLVYINQVGGQDELVFDGLSFVVDASGNKIAQLPAWSCSTTEIKFNHDGKKWQPEIGEISLIPDEIEMTYRALMHGLRDYTRKNGFEEIVIGLSGGIDSALSAAIAVDALGASKVHCILLPSMFTSKESIVDASKCLTMLGANSQTHPIQSVVESILEELKESFAGKDKDTTEENIQARVRAIILMAISNKFGHMALTTGNKSEMSVGYATLYGDMSGGFSVLKDVYKTRVYALAEWRNTHMPESGLGPKGQAIPEEIINKIPTAELRPNQTDQDTLPPYEELDQILYLLIDEDKGIEEIINSGHSAPLVAQIENMVYSTEYKRRQAPPGVRISRRNFGRDRRYPITNSFRQGHGSCSIND